MKYAAIALIMGLGSIQASANDHFKPWCDAHTAQGLISLAANRIFGQIPTSGQNALYQQRKDWVNAAYQLAEARFKESTGIDLLTFNPAGEWYGKCQLKDQLN